MRLYFILYFYIVSVIKCKIMKLCAPECIPFFLATSIFQMIINSVILIQPLNSMSVTVANREKEFLKFFTI